ncbi:MAG: hypothetical protein FJ125_00310 [Deltaproteobacteria bacterium]|nr:hypothetical protein [Deltaproteobacteria bacterium]
MSRLPEPYRPYVEMSPLEQRQYLDCRIWCSRALEVCFICETAHELEPYEGGFICGRCRTELEDVSLPDLPGE